MKRPEKGETYVQYEFVAVVLSCLFVALCAFPQTVCAQGIEPIQLLEPETDGGKPLMQVLPLRKTSRYFSSREIPLQTLSNLLWAAFGINRPESGKRTAPSAVNWQEIDIYVAMEKGVYFYSQNVYLFCASEGLATVVRGRFDRNVLTKKLSLKSSQKVLLCQTVGYPAE